MLARIPCKASLGRRPTPFLPVAAPTRSLVRANSGPPQMTPQMAQQMQEAMKDPNFAKRMAEMQEMMKNPEMQQQMAQMQAAMANQGLQQRMAQLKDDPEFADIFADIQKGGMSALMKYYNDPDFLAKLGDKLGDVVPTGGAGPAAAAAPPPSMAPGASPEAPEINNIRDAAKYGDEEAVEDFIAIGKDLNEADGQGRTALHYSVAYDHPVIAKMLIDEGASVEVRDSMKNTPLHYAAGYGRVTQTRMLLDAGADIKVQNNTGKTPADLAKLDARNPVNTDADLLKRLTF